MSNWSKRCRRKRMKRKLIKGERSRRPMPRASDEEKADWARLIDDLERLGYGPDINAAVPRKEGE